MKLVKLKYSDATSGYAVNTRNPIKNGDPRRGYLRVTLTPDGDRYGARLTGTQSSGVLRSMVTADGLAIVPGQATIQPGEEVKVIVLRPGF